MQYAGSPLASGRSYRWRARCWTDPGGEPGPWSEARSETGLLDDSLWKARWISGPAPTCPDDFRARHLRGTVQVPAPVVRARAFVSALGWYRFVVNGSDLTGPALVPRWTPFDEYAEYQAYDVTEALRTGGNVLGMVSAGQPRTQRRG